MNALLEKKEHNLATLKVTVDGEIWEKALKKVNNKAVSSLQIPGFRKGKVPAKLVEKYINREQVRLEAAEECAQEAFAYGIEEHKDLRIVDQVRLENVENVTEEGCELTFGLTLYPEVKLGDYKSLKYSEPKVTVKKAEIEEEIKKILERQAEEVLKEEGKIEDGNIAVIDFEGFVDGVAFDGGKGEDFPLEIGSHSFVDNFEEQLIGLQTGDQKDVVVTFPKNYTAELAGKEATFKVTVKGIKEKQLPELNDELVEELKYEGVHTVEELNAFLKKNIKEKKQQENEDKAVNDLLDKLSECCEVEIPEAMIDSEVENSYREQESNLQQQGFNMDLYFKITGTDEATLKEQLRPASEAKVRTRVLLEAVGKDMNVQVSEKDLEDEYQAMADQYGMEADKIKELIPADYLSEDIKMKKTLEELKKQN